MPKKKKLINKLKMEENSNCLIIDTGSWSCKAGLSNEDNPQIIMPTYIGVEKKENGSILKYGKEAFQKSPNYKTESLFQNSKVKDWDKMEKFWENLIKNNLTLNITERATMTSYYSNCDKNTKERTTQIFFESFNVPYYYTASNALLSLYSSGRVSGIVVDVGHSKTSICPIFDGSPFNFAQNHSSFAGANLTNFLQKEYNLDFETAQALKNKNCRVSMDFEKESKDLLNPTNMVIEDEENKVKFEKEFILPDKTKIGFKDNMIKMGESLFNPKIINENFIGIHNLIHNSIQKVEYDYRKDLVSHIIVTGGTTNCTNFNERISKELFLYVPTNMKIKCYNLSERSNAVWFGGAIVSYLGTFQPMWITRNEYDECGPSIINRKCI